MANIKSAKKRINVTEKKTLRNKMIKSRTKTQIKKVVLAVKSGDQTAANANLITAIRAIDKACSKGVYHKNTASRKKSRLAKFVGKMG